MKAQEKTEKSCIFCNSTELLREIHSSYVCEICKEEVKAQYKDLKATDV